MNTTVAISQDLKRQLDELKHSERDSYQNVIHRLLENTKNQKLEIKNLQSQVDGLIEDSRKTLKFFLLFYGNEHREKILFRAINEARAHGDAELLAEAKKAEEEEWRMSARLVNPPLSAEDLKKAQELMKKLDEAKRKGLSEVTIGKQKFRILTPEEQKAHRQPEYDKITGEAVEISIPDEPKKKKKGKTA